MNKKKIIVGVPISEEDSIASPFARKNATDKVEEQLEELFHARDSYYKLEDVILPEHTKLEVLALIAKIENHHILYDEWELSRIDPTGKRVVFNLYGPPGTGKTMLAEAIADKFGKKIIEINYAEIESKYVGDTPKNIVAAFDSASKNDAILFFDEADSILGKRMTSVTQAADHGVNVSRAVMLKQLDSCCGIVMFATNLVQNFDTAFIRRILYHIEIPIPDEKTLGILWRKKIPDAVPGRSELDFDVLAKESIGLVGAEIKNAVILAATHAVQREGLKRKITTKDLLQSIDIVRRSKQHISGYAYTRVIDRLDVDNKTDILTEGKGENDVD